MEDLDVHGEQVKLMIRNGWMEQSPQTVGHKELAHV